VLVEVKEITRGIFAQDNTLSRTAWFKHTLGRCRKLYEFVSRSDRSLDQLASAVGTDAVQLAFGT